MAGGVDGLQLAQGDAGVDLGAGDVGVAEHLLHVADVGAAFEHQGRHRVAEQVTGAGLADARVAQVGADQAAQVLGVQDYYSGEGEEAGQWIGDAAARLGFDGEVGEDQLVAMPTGRNPVDNKLFDRKCCTRRDFAAQGRSIPAAMPILRREGRV
jgi:hypothetical protein